MKVEKSVPKSKYNPKIQKLSRIQPEASLFHSVFVNMSEDKVAKRKLAESDAVNFEFSQDIEEVKVYVQGYAGHSFIATFTKTSS